MRFVRGLLFSAVLTSTATATELDVAGGIEYFQWQEYSDSGSRLLKETGPRYFVALVGTNRLAPHWHVDFGGRLYSGTVNYDGQTMNGIPVTTDTDYNGVRAELGFVRDLGAARTAANASWLLRFALGRDQWRRGLKDTALADGTPVSGYVERYASDYAKLGVTYLRQGAWSVGIGAKAPLHTREEVNIGLSTLTLNPEGQLSLYAKAVFPVSGTWAVAIDYDSYRYAKSDPVFGYYQPESRQDTLGLALHGRF